MTRTGDEDPAPAAGGRSDLRYTRLDDGHTEIERDLGSSGRLARGDHTHMHSVHFTARGAARPRQKLAPEDTATERRDNQAPAAPDARDGGRTAEAPPAGMARRMFDWMLGRDSR